MTTIPHSIIETNDEKFVTAFVGGQALVAHSSHGNFSEIVAAIKSGEAANDVDAFRDLFDVAKAVARKFAKLSERVSVEGNNILFDGTPVHSVLTEQIIRFLDEGVEDYKPLVAFYEKLEQNPSADSREQLYRWLQTHAFTITGDGDIVGYKGVNSDLGSCTRGPGIVNGEPQKGNLDNTPGNVLEIDRSTVVWDPSRGCAFGLHVGDWSYASTFGSKTVEVRVNPRDVVSVPTDCADRKMRVARYVVVQEIDRPYGAAVIYNDGDDDLYGFDVDDPQPEGADARDEYGRWVAGRVSERDPQTGRFVG